MNNESIAERLNQAQVALDNAQNHPEVGPLLAAYGYDAAKLQAGRAKYDQAHALHQAQKEEYAQQHEATRSLQAKWDTANSEYMRLVKVGRVAFQTQGLILEKLGLLGRRKESLSGWLDQASVFFNEALADQSVIAGYAAYGIAEQRLQDARDLYRDVETANTEQEKEKGEAQQSTKDRDKALDDLGGFIADLRKIARIALEGRPQLLEMLEIFVRS